MGDKTASSRHGGEGEGEAGEAGHGEDGEGGHYGEEGHKEGGERGEREGGEGGEGEEGDGSSSSVFTPMDAALTTTAPDAATLCAGSTACLEDMADMAKKVREKTASEEENANTASEGTSAGPAATGALAFLHTPTGALIVVIGVVAVLPLAVWVMLRRSKARRVVEAGFAQIPGEVQGFTQIEAEGYDEENSLV